jgi:hypothetical protein
MKRAIFVCCLIVVAFMPDLSMGQSSADISVPGFYFCRFSSRSGGGIMRLQLGTHGTVTYASGILKTRGHFCRYRTMSQGQYSSVGQDLEAMIVLSGAAGLLCPADLRAPEVMISIETGAAGQNWIRPRAKARGNVFTCAAWVNEPIRKTAVTRAGRRPGKVIPSRR